MDTPKKRHAHLEALLPADAETLPVWTLRSDETTGTLAALTEAQRGWLDATGWKPEADAVGLVPDADGALAGAVLGLGKEAAGGGDPLIAGALANAVPAGCYHFASALDDPELAAVAWALGTYEFSRYKAGEAREPRALRLPDDADRDAVLRIAEGFFLGRDRINTPANDLGPAELEAAARALADAHGAALDVTVGEALLGQNFPMIHAVGRASDREPRLIDLTWGDERAPKLTLVGKGICFDTGGLNLKPAQSMALMKKDMGGAAAVLALALMIMDAGLPVRLRVLIPAADNNVSANAFRPGDVLESRKGVSVEIGNTDAEGRLVLADAMALADEEAPDTLITMATLTGAARVALGPDLPPLYSDDDAFADEILAAGTRVGDPLWRMPFWEPYDKLLKGKTGDVNHISSGAFAGSVTAALFLKRFVEKAKRYVHLDIYGWVPQAKPARPEGGEPQGARALFELFRRTFAA
ncbi:MAG: leucyl aminopeptidase family protein [Methyloligellaceae bacterium]